MRRTSGIHTRRIITSVTVLVMAIYSVALLGCGAQGFLLNSQGQNLFQAFDVITTPGQEVELVTRIQGGQYMSGVPGRTVEFRYKDMVIGTAITGSDGIAKIDWDAPSNVGDYNLTAQVIATEADTTNYGSEPLLVAVRHADQKILISDIDDTISHSSTQDVLFGTPAAFDDSADVLKRCRDAGWTIIYLTHRPDYYNRKSRQWLKDKGYPIGPLLTSKVDEFVSGSGTFKTAKVGEVMRSFPNIRIGVGDKISDCQAYFDNGVKTCIRIMAFASTPEALRQQARELDALDPSVHVVTSWKQVEKVIFEGATYPRPNMQSVLELKARELGG